MSNIAKCIINHINNPFPCIICYDDFTSDSNAKIGINNAMKYCKLKYNTSFAIFKPGSVEECALSFTYLPREINNIAANNISICNEINKYLLTGSNYAKYDINTSKYKIGNIVLNIDGSDYSKYLKEKITNIERYLANILAEITFDNPYEFIKRANECWYNNCNCSDENGYCILANILGTKRPNNKAMRCNKILYDYDKVAIIIENSIFGCIYDALLELSAKGPKITNQLLYSRVIEII